MSTGYNSCIINRLTQLKRSHLVASYLGGWNFDQRSPSTSDVHLGLRKAARGWLKAVATDRTAHPAQTLNFAGIYVALRTFA
jgi:hypothetical protein